VEILYQKRPDEKYKCHIHESRNLFETIQDLMWFIAQQERLGRVEKNRPAILFT